MTPTNNKLKVQDVEISLATIDNQDYISLTDMAKGKNDEARAADIIKNWIRNRSTLEFLGTWEILYNPNFKVVEFDHFKKEAGLPTFTISVSNWVESTNAIGILVETIKEQRAVLDKVDYLKSIKKLSNDTYISMESNKQLDK